MTTPRPDLTNPQWSFRKHIIQDFANIYFNVQDDKTIRPDVKDDHHNMFVEVVKEIHDKYEKDGWLSVYLWMKQLKGTQV